MGGSGRGLTERTMKLLELLRRSGQARRVGAVGRRSIEVSPRPAPAPRPPSGAPGEPLSAAARAWLRNLPGRVRPLQLCAAFPRIANRLASCWNDAALSDAVFNGLLLDDRGGRKGFPRGVAAELLRLQAYHERRTAEGSAGHP
jgi:hypothetical protein